MFDLESRSDFSRYLCKTSFGAGQGFQVREAVMEFKAERSKPNTFWEVELVKNQDFGQKIFPYFKRRHMPDAPIFGSAPCFHRL